jgi:hypothetical protein
MCASATAENRLVWAEQSTCRERDGKRERELAVAVKAVQIACTLCQRVQEALLLPAGQNSSLKTSKDDRSPVTVAGLKIDSFFYIRIFGSYWIILSSIDGGGIKYSLESSWPN